MKGASTAQIVFGPPSTAEMIVQIVLTFVLSGALVYYAWATSRPKEILK
jgi:hypothetical protein